MSFFLNPFSEDFRGNWVLGDRHHIPVFEVRGNCGRGRNSVICWEEGPYDLSGNDDDGDSMDILEIQFAIDGNAQIWIVLGVDITSAATSTAAVTARNVITDLNSDDTFSAYFTAELVKFGNDTDRVQIRQKFDEGRQRFFIRPGRAEEALAFNRRAGVAEIPTYFTRHRVRTELSANEQTSFTDNLNMLLALNPDASGGDSHLAAVDIVISASAVHDNIIANAVDCKGNSLNLDNTAIQEDWQLLQGRSGIFEFTRQVSGTGPDEEERIVFPAGAVVGDLATRILIDSSGHEFRMPHTLVSADLVTP